MSSDELKDRVLRWRKSNDGGRLIVWWPAGSTEEKPGYPIMAVGCDHGGTIEYGTFYDAKDADKMALICDVFNWAIEQLVPSEQSFYGERDYLTGFISFGDGAMSELRARIVDALREHVSDDYGYCRKCTRYGALVKGGNKHLADVLLSYRAMDQRPIIG